MTEHSGASANKWLASEYTPLFPEGGREVVVILEAQDGQWEIGGGHAPLEGWPITAAFRVRRSSRSMDGTLPHPRASCRWHDDALRSRPVMQYQLESSDLELVRRQGQVRMRCGSCASHRRQPNSRHTPPGRRRETKAP
jgi:hypothetical protein